VRQVVAKVNAYDHEDAFKEANLCAGNKIKLVDALKICKDKEVARVIISELRDQYQALFDAFIEGVDYGRRNPLPEDEDIE
jgi:hypothetical protein